MCKIVVLYTSSKDVVHLWPFYLNRCLFYIIMFLGYIELVLQPWPLDFECLVRGSNSALQNEIQKDLTISEVYSLRECYSLKESNGASQVAHW